MNIEIFHLFNFRLETKYVKTKTRLIVLGAAMALASPFAVGVLALNPPFAFVSLFLYYLIGKISHFKCDI